MSWVGEAIINFNNWRAGVAKIKSSLKKDTNPIRIGILGAAAINFTAVIDPTQTHPSVVLTGIAARDKSKAEAQIAKYGIGPTCKAYGSYDELLADPTIDAVYIPLPNGLHTEWAIKVMQAGKHVLIEKPIANNANEAHQIREVAQQTAKIALEAFHWRFHPAAHHCKAIIDSGDYGNITGIAAHARLCRGIIGKDDIRFKYGLGGGASMDLTYVFSACQYFAGPDTTNAGIRMLEATPRLCPGDAKVDEAMKAKFVLENPGKPPVTCDVEADLSIPPLWGFIPQIWRQAILVTIQLEKAEIAFDNFFSPHMTHSIVIRDKDNQGKLTGTQRTEKCYIDGPIWGKRGQPWWSTYRYQMEAFVEMIRAQENATEYPGPQMTLSESHKVMEIIDHVYEKAGLPLRGV